MNYMKSTADFLEKSGLYNQVEISEETFSDLDSFYHGYGQIEVFCPKCQKDRIFKRPTIYTINDNNRKDKKAFTELFTYRPEIEQYTFECTNDNDHKIYYVIMCHEDDYHDKKYLTKIGQYPSYTDLSRPLFLKYKKLKNNYYSDLNRASGLFDSGIGIGSFIYLRRIVEKLIEQAGANAIKEEKITSEQFEFRKIDGERQTRNTVVEKIALLRGYLPDVMVDNPQIYSIVSKGVHELSENECLSYFPILQSGIQMILDDLLAQQQRLADEKKYKEELGRIVGEIK